MVNRGRGIVEGWRSDALLTMQEDGVDSYTHRGITLLRKRGAEKLEVKSDKGGGEAAPAARAAKTRKVAVDENEDTPDGANDLELD